MKETRYVGSNPEKVLSGLNSFAFKILRMSESSTEPSNVTINSGRVIKSARSKCRSGAAVTMLGLEARTSVNFSNPFLSNFFSKGI